MNGGRAMRFLKSLRGFFRHSSDGEQEPAKYIRPPPPLAFPRGSTSLSIQFPSGIETPDRKVIYALRKEGAQPYENLLLLTELPKSQIDSALQDLVEQNRVKKKDLPAPFGETTPLFSLSRQRICHDNA